MRKETIAGCCISKARYSVRGNKLTPRIRKRIANAEVRLLPHFLPKIPDTIPLNAEAKACSKIRQLSTAELLAETIRRISDEESVSSLYLD